MTRSSGVVIVIANGGSQLLSTLLLGRTLLAGTFFDKLFRAHGSLRGV